MKSSNFVAFFNIRATGLNRETQTKKTQYLMKHNSLFSANGLLHNPLASTTIKSSFLTAIFKPLLMLFLLVMGSSVVWGDTYFKPGETIYLRVSGDCKNWYNNGGWAVIFYYAGNDNIAYGQNEYHERLWNGTGDLSSYLIRQQTYSPSVSSGKSAYRITSIGAEVNNERILSFTIPTDGTTCIDRFRLCRLEANVNEGYVNGAQHVVSASGAGSNKNRVHFSAWQDGDGTWESGTGQTITTSTCGGAPEPAEREISTDYRLRGDLWVYDDDGNWAGKDHNPELTLKSYRETDGTYTFSYIAPVANKNRFTVMVGGGADKTASKADGSSSDVTEDGVKYKFNVSTPKQVDITFNPSTNKAKVLLSNYTPVTSGWYFKCESAIGGVAANTNTAMAADGTLLLENVAAGTYNFYIHNNASELYWGQNKFGGCYVDQTNSTASLISSKIADKKFDGKQWPIKKVSDRKVQMVVSGSDAGKNVRISFDGGKIVLTLQDPPTPANTYTVTLHPNNGGDNIERTNVPEGSNSSAAALNLAEVNYGVGTATWYTNPECTTPFNTVTGNMDLYAKWGVSGNYYVVGDLWMYNSDGDWDNNKGQLMTNTNGVCTVTYTAPEGLNRIEIIKDRDWYQKINGGSYSAVLNASSPISLSVNSGHIAFTLAEAKRVTITFDGKVSVSATDYSFDQSVDWRVKTSDSGWGNNPNSWDHSNVMTKTASGASIIIQNVPANTNHSFMITRGNDEQAAVGTYNFNALWLDTSNPSSGLTWNMQNTNIGDRQLAQTDNEWRNCSFRLSVQSDLRITFDGGKIRCDIVAPNTVTFNSNGGSAVASQEVSNGGTASEPSAPTKEGYTFVKWQLNGVDYHFTETVTEDITLDAIWVYKAISSVVLNESTHMTWVGNSDFALTPTLTPSDAIAKSVAWSSNATGVATVSDGTVHAVAAGEARITCTVTDQFDHQVSAYCDVTVAACEMATENLYSMTVTGYESSIGSSADLSGLWNESSDNDGPATFRIVKLKLSNNYYIYDDNGTVKMSTDASLATAQWYEIPTNENFSPNWTGSSFALYEFKNVSTGRYMRRGNGRYGNNDAWYYYTTLADSRTTDGNQYKFFYDNTMGTHLVCRDGADYNEGNTITELRKAFAIHNNNLNWPDGYSGHCAAPMVICGYTNDPQNNTYTKLHETVEVNPSYPNPNYKASQMNGSYYRIKENASVQANLNAALVSGAVITVRLYADAATSVQLTKANGTLIETIDLSADAEREYSYTVASNSALLDENAFVIKATDNHAGIASIVVTRTYAISLAQLIEETEIGGTLTLTCDYATDNAVIDKAITINGGNHTIGDLKIENTGDLTLGSGLTVRDFTICAKAGNTSTPAASGQVRNATNLTCSRNAYFLYTVDPSGHVQYGWYDFTVPFPVNAASGIKGIQEGVLKENFAYGPDYAIMDYDGAKQAQGQYPYKKFSGVMQPNKLYSITLDDDYNYNTLRMQKTAEGPLVAGDDVTLEAHDGDDLHKNWNGVGNGTLHHADAGISGNYVQVYQSGDKTFLPVNTDDYSFVVGTAFMVQESGTMTLNQATHGALLAPSRYESAPATAIQIAREGQPFSDQLFISASETGGQAYTPGTDLAKAGTLGSANVPQIWTTAYNNPLCVHEAQLINGEASYNLSLYAPAADTYTLTSLNIPADYSLYLTQNGTMLTELNGTYTLDLNKGITTEYGLLLVETYKTPTGIEESGIRSQESGIRKILHNGVLYILHNGKIYNAQGGKVCDL